MNPYYTDDSVTLYHGDCREFLPHLAPATLVLTDPPYGIVEGAAVVRRNTTTIENWGAEAHNVTVSDWRELVVTADAAWIVEFGAMAGNHFLAAEHVKAGWTPCNVYALVKQAPPPTPRPGLCSAVELALVSKVGKPKWHGTGYVPNRWIGLTPNRTGQSSGHPTQKPVEPFAALIRAMASPDNFVLDPFAGSGTTLRAAKDEGHKAIGVEIDERYCEIAAKRLCQDVLDFGGGAA